MSDGQFVIGAAEAQMPDSGSLDEWGGWEGAAQRAADLVNTPDLLRLVQSMCAEQPRPEGSTTAFLAVVDALTKCSNPALFGEVLEFLLGDCEALPTVGRRLSEVCLDRTRPPAEADARQWLLAMYALEGATRLALGGLTSQFGVFAVLVDLPAVAAPVYVRAGLRCLAVAYERWREPQLVTALERLAGVGEAGDSPAGERQRVEEGRFQIEPDAAFELGSVALLQALTADSAVEAEGHLVAAERRFSVATAAGREDATVYGDVVRLLRAHLPTDAGRALWRATDLGELARRLRQGVRQHLVGAHELGHWRSPRLDAEVAWAKLAEDVVSASEAVQEPSWYDVERVLADVLAAWTASRCSRVMTVEDQKGVQAILGPAIESGIALQAGLMKHLEDHVGELGRREHEGAGSGAAQTVTDDALIEELSACHALLQAARSRLTSPEPRPKSDGGVGSGSPERVAALPLLTRATGGDVEAVAAMPVTAALRVEAVLAQSRIASGGVVALVVEETFAELRQNLLACADYQREDVRHAVDQLVWQLLLFWQYLSGMSPSQMDWLYKADAVEQDLHDELHRFLHASGLGHRVAREVPDIGGGRVDIICAFDGFHLVLEMKRDSSRATPVKGKYVLQAASYQAADVAVGFLVVLGLTRRPTTPDLRSCFNVQVLTDPSIGTPRYVVTALVPGNRTAPSASTTRGMAPAL